MNKRWRLCSLGRRQSPIDIHTDRLIYDHLLDPIRLNWLKAGALDPDQAGSSKEQTTENKLIKAQLYNSGRGIEIWFEGGLQKRAASKHSEQLILSHGPLSYAYKLFKIELHSSSGLTSSGLLTNQIEDTKVTSMKHTNRITRDSNSDSSLNFDDFSSSDSKLNSNSMTSSTSEHLLDGKAFDGELELYFYNKHLASSASEALQQLSGSPAASSPEESSHLFAVISVFIIKTTNSSNSANEPPPPAPPAGSAIDFIMDNLDAIPNHSDSKELSLTKSQILSLVPDLNHYITYQGSLNKPPCSEGVEWILVNKALKVDSGKFKGLFESKLNTNQDNIRPVQPLHRRLLRTTILNTQNSMNNQLNNVTQCDTSSNKVSRKDQLVGQL